MMSPPTILVPISRVFCLRVFSLDVSVVAFLCKWECSYMSVCVCAGWWPLPLKLPLEPLLELRQLSFIALQEEICGRKYFSRVIPALIYGRTASNIFTEKPHFWRVFHNLWRNHLGRLTSNTVWYFPSFELKIFWVKYCFGGIAFKEIPEKH